MMRKIIGYPSATINRQKVSSTSNGLENNDLNSRLSPPITFQLYSPYSSIGITLIIMHKPIDQCARMRLVVVMKWKEEKNLPNFHSFHTWLWIIQNNESCIMLWITMETQSWPYSLTAHTPHSTQVAGCIECGNGRMVDHDLAVKLRAPTDCSGWEGHLDDWECGDTGERQGGTLVVRWMQQASWGPADSYILHEFSTLLSPW